MKAVIVNKHGGPEVLKIQDVEIPKIPDGHVLIRVQAAGVNPVDTYLRSGSQGYTTVLPFTPGIDAAGTVADVGRGVEGIKTGDPVYTAGSVSGTYAEYSLCTSNQVYPLPRGLTWQEGASLGVAYFTAARALFTRGDSRAGETILIHGATGGVGIAALQLASHRGLTVFGTAGSQEGHKLVETLGGRCFHHHDQKRFDGIRKASGGGVNLIIEMLGDANLDSDLKILAPGGRIVVVGSRGSIEISPRDLMSVEGDIRGVRMFLATEDELRSYAQEIEQRVQEGKVKPVIAEVLPIEEAAEAHRAVMRGPHLGKIVLDLE